MSKKTAESEVLPDDALYCIFEHLQVDSRPRIIANVDFRNVALSSPLLLSHGRRLLYSTIAVHSGAGGNDLDVLATLEGELSLIEDGIPLARLVKAMEVCTWDGSLSAQAFGTLDALWRICPNLSKVTFPPIRASDLEQAVVSLSQSPVARNLESLSLSQTQTSLLPTFFRHVLDGALQRLTKLRSISFRGGSWPESDCAPFRRLTSITLDNIALTSFIPLLDAAAETLVNLRIDVRAIGGDPSNHTPTRLATPAARARSLTYNFQESPPPADDVAMINFANDFCDFLTSFPFLTHLTLRLPFHSDRLSAAFDDSFAQIVESFASTLVVVRFHHRHYTQAQIGAIVAWIQRSSNLKRIEFQSYFQGNGVDLLEKACATAGVELSRL